MRKSLLTTFVFCLIAASLNAQGRRDQPNNQPQTPPVRHTDVYIGNSHGGYPHVDGRPMGNPHYMEPMRVADREQVQLIIDYIKGVTFDKEKLRAAILCVKLVPVLSEDLARIVPLFTFDDAKKEFLKEAFRYCPDPEHYHVAVDKLTFNSSREEVYRVIYYKGERR